MLELKLCANVFLDIDSARRLTGALIVCLILCKQVKL
jgi:hypothetical protein